ncbi:MAG: hypothetical protein ACC742_13905, partial [Thermoanaerobaculales bacterium]
MHHTQRCFLASGCSPRRQQREVAEGSPERIDDLLHGQFLRKVLCIEYHPQRQGTERLRYWIDENARSRLHTEVFGKRIVVTNRHEWSTEDILLAYRGQNHVES